MNSFEHVRDTLLSRSKSRDTLLSRSKSKRDYEKALEEWDYVGNFHDNEISSALCQLCGQPGIRYEFQIVNRINQNTLLVGSECITKFGITVYDEYGNKITGSSAYAKVTSDKRKLVADAKTMSVINSLLVLASKDPEFEIQNFIAYYQERGAFTPKQLSLLVWRLKRLHVPHEKSHFKVIMRRSREKQQILALPDWQLAQIQPCLTVTQMGWLRRNGKL